MMYYFLPSNSDVMATDGGIYRTDDCFKDTVEWTSLNNGYLTSQLYTATTSKKNSEVLHGGFQDNGNFVTFSGNPTDHWSMPSMEMGFTLELQIMKKTFILLFKEE